MLKVVSIDHIEPDHLTCIFNNGSRRKLDVKPLFQYHKHLNGISDLLDEKTFLSAEVGLMGEVLWKNSIRTANNEVWDYDISPGFIYYHGMKANTKHVFPKMNFF